MKVTLEDLLSLGLSERSWLRNMPPTLADVARIVGIEATLRFALHYGGEGAYLPAWHGRDPEAPKKWALTKVVGEEAAIKIVDHFGGGVSFPVAAGFNGRIYRRLLAVAMLEKGATIRDVCQSVGVARSMAYEWKKNFLEEGSKTPLPCELQHAPTENNEFEAVLKPVERDGGIFRPTGAARA